MVPRPTTITVASRERNRIHAQRTRQRKKEQMQILQSRADDLKKEQLRLKQTVNEKTTANILVCLLAASETASDQADCCENPAVEELLRRPTSAIPDATKIPDLPSLILPGQHASKKMKANAKIDISLMPEGTAVSSPSTSTTAHDDIDYELLGRDRSQCTPAELDRIRRERNRMHAKRTRDRKRMFVVRLEEICRQLEDENAILHEHLKKLDPEYVYEPIKTVSSPASPKIQPIAMSDLPVIGLEKVQSSANSRGVSCDLATLLRAAQRTMDANEVSDATGSDEDDSRTPSKRQRTTHAMCTHLGLS